MIWTMRDHAAVLQMLHTSHHARAEACLDLAEGDHLTEQLGNGGLMSTNHVVTHCRQHKM